MARIEPRIDREAAVFAARQFNGCIHFVTSSLLQAGEQYSTERQDKSLGAALLMQTGESFLRRGPRCGAV